MPHFSFAAPSGSLFVFCGVGIVGMHLNGQFVVGENEFHKQREFTKVIQVRSAPLHRHFMPTFTERFPGKGTVCNAAILSGKPRLAEKLLQVGLPWK